MKNKYLADLPDYVFPENGDMTYIYFITWTPFKRKPWHDRVKIGMSKNPDQRRANLQTAHPSELKIWHRFKVPADKAREVEDQLHRKFRWSRERGEWFVIHPAVRNWIKAHKCVLAATPNPPTPEPRRFILRKNGAKWID